MYMCYLWVLCGIAGITRTSTWSSRKSLPVGQGDTDLSNTGRITRNDIIRNDIIYMYDTTQQSNATVKLNIVYVPVQPVVI